MNKTDPTTYGFYPDDQQSSEKAMTRQRTIYFKDSDLWDAAQQKAALEKTSVSQVIEELLRQWTFGDETDPNARIVSQIRELVR